MAKKTVGQVLRDQRAKLDMTLNAAEALTQIKKMYIVALEHDDYDALPGDFYVKAYLKQYAERLDLDYDQLVTAYEKNEPIEVDETPDLSESYQFVKPSERLEADEELGDKKWRYYLPIVLLGTVAALIIISISATVVLNKPKNSGIAEHLYSVSNSSKSKASASHPAPSTSSISSESKAPEPPKPEIAVTGNGQALAATVKNVASPVKVNLSTAAGLAVWIGMTNSDLPGGQITLTNATPTTTTLTGNQTVLTLGKTTGLTIKIGDTPIDLSSIVAPESPATLTITIE
ncbi:helix-turn-helix domain-containing protein [Lactococcus chungangensis]|uniref:helix-turn-helix domain-containing protein n=1 Tax=Pseudolactococcus chungangensis TaxID=451457 RepID=UPI0028D8ED58|nr:helix-turn-helix domain-containing protein [Lactococcus chungangensis]